MVDPFDLMRFGESDLKILAKMQIVHDESLEQHAKKYTAGLAFIIANEGWAGGKADSEVRKLSRTK